MHKYKFSKTKCKSCIYHRGGSQNKGAVYCNYASITGQTCLHRGEKGAVLDRRGTDYHNCQLYIKGQIESEVRSPM